MEDGKGAVKLFFSGGTRSLLLSRHLFRRHQSLWSSSNLPTYLPFPLLHLPKVELSPFLLPLWRRADEPPFLFSLHRNSPGSLAFLLLLLLLFLKANKVSPVSLNPFFSFGSLRFPINLTKEKALSFLLSFCRSFVLSFPTVKSPTLDPSPAPLNKGPLFPFLSHSVKREIGTAAKILSSRSVSSLPPFISRNIMGMGKRD